MSLLAYSRRGLALLIDANAAVKRCYGQLGGLYDVISHVNTFLEPADVFHLQRL